MFEVALVNDPGANQGGSNPQRNTSSRNSPVARNQNLAPGTPAVGDQGTGFVAGVAMPMCSDQFTLWAQYMGIGTMATGAGLMAESRRRSLLPEVCSSHGRTCMMQGDSHLSTTQISMAYAQQVARLLARGMYLTLLFTPATAVALLLYVVPHDRLKQFWCEPTAYHSDALASLRRLISVRPKLCLVDSCRYSLLRHTLEHGGSAFIK